MSNNCSVENNNAEVIVENDNLKQEKHDISMPIVDNNVLLNKMLESKFGLGAEVSAEQLEEVFREMYGTGPVAKKMALVHSIQALLDANRAIIPMVHGLIRRRIGETKYSGAIVPVHTKIFTGQFDFAQADRTTLEDLLATDAYDIILNNMTLEDYIDYQEKSNTSFSKKELKEIYNKAIESKAAFLEDPMQMILDNIKEYEMLIEKYKQNPDEVEHYQTRILALENLLKQIPDEYQDVHRIDNLQEMETPTLNIIYQKSLAIVYSVAKGGMFGNFGGIMVQLKTPKQLRYQDKSGGFNEITKATSTYADNIATRINMFLTDVNILNAEMKKIMGKDWDEKRDKVQLSMTEINNILKALSRRDLKDEWGNTLIPEVNTPTTNNRVQTIFHGLMKGWMKIGDGKTYVAISDGRQVTEEDYKKNPSEHMLLEEDELYIFKDYGDILDEKATAENGFKTFVRHPDNTRVRKFQNLIKLYDFVPPNGIEGSWYVGFSTEQLTEIKQMVVEARKIDNHAHKYMAHHLPKTTNNLLNELYQMFNGKFTNEELRYLFFKEFEVDEQNIIRRKVDEEWAEIEVTQEDLNLIEGLKAVFGMNIAEELTIPNAAKVYLDKVERESFMANHFPSLYDYEAFQTMLGDLIATTENELNEFTESVGLVYDEEKGTYIPDPKNDTFWRSFTKDRQKAAKAHIKNLASRLESATKIRQDMAGVVTEDAQLGVTIPLAGQNKYFKRISGAYDIRNSRRDDGVYYDYLKNMMGTLERNNLTASLVKTYRLLNQGVLGGKIDNDHREVVMEVATNLYKVPFASPDLKGPMNITMESFTKKVNGFYGLKFWGKEVKRTPQQLQMTLRTIASSLTGMYLGGAGSAITNYSGQFQNIIDYGWDQMKEATNLYKSTKLLPLRDENGNVVVKDGQVQYSNVTVGERIRQIIEESGLVNFNEFFSQSMVNGIAQAAIERDIHANIIAAMIVYHSKKLNGTRQEIADAEIEMSETINELLKQSSTFIDANNLIINEKKRKPEEALDVYESRKKQLKKNRRRDIAHALVQYAINKEVEFTSVLRKGTGPLRKLLSKNSVLEAIKNRTLNLGEEVLTWYADTIKKFGLTMGDTESYIRSISFVIGANRAHRANQLLGGTDIQWYEYQDSDYIADVITWGKDFSNFTNFGLSTQDTGQFNYNGLGNLMGKFKYWSQQKFGRDIRTIQEAYYSFKDFSDITNQKFSAKAIARMVKEMMDPRIDQQTLREKNPALAQFRTWFFVQGGMTMFWDLMLFGLPIPGLSSLRAYAFGSKSILGMSATKALRSDLFSLMMFPFTLAAKMAMMGDWDDEDFEFTLTYFLRMSFLGFLPMKGWDALMSIMYATTENERKAIDKTVDTFSPVLGGQTGPGRFIQHNTKASLKNLLDEDI
tara:strand:- start:620 stop:4822 length:4203 start_codon:yes stop_codon:yes gene_type:complete